MKKKIWLSMVTVIVVGILSTASRATILDQSQEILTAGISVNNNEHTAQGFLHDDPGALGLDLAEIWVKDVIHGADSYPLDITLEIRNGASVDPTVLTIAHTEDFTLTAAPGDEWHKFIFASPVALTTGGTYTFRLKGAAGNTGTTVFGINTAPSYGGTGLILSTSANGGASWGAPGGFQYDMTFRTYLVPEPATLGLLALGSLVLIRSRRR
jgi:hypothetical protein